MSKTKVELNGKNILVTGSPGFIGANLVMRLLNEMNSGTVISFDMMNDYKLRKITTLLLTSLPIRPACMPTTQPFSTPKSTVPTARCTDFPRLIGARKFKFLNVFLS